MITQENFSLVFNGLRKILQPYAAGLDLRHDTDELYHLDGPYSEKWKKVIFFASVQVRKNYVSFYLMPVYMFPELLEDISPELKKHMQGKSCFNFRKVEPALFSDLAELTHRSVERFRQDS